jgi:hypothetical protein
MSALRPLLVIVSLCCAMPALAQTPAPQGLPPEANLPAVKAAQSACNADIAKFCPTVQPGGGRIVRCLVANAPQLTPACRTGMLAARSAVGL